MRRFDSAERAEIVRKSQQCLWSSEGTPGLEYLTGQRRLSERIIRSFGLGYLPADLKHSLAGRIIFPLYDASNNLIVVSSRHVDGDTRLPVYWHESYEKSFYLYGIRNALAVIREWCFAVVVEGQFDVLQMHNHGILNAVGLCATLMGDVQLSVIYRYCEEIVLVLDKDENQAGQKGIETILAKYGINRSLALPEYRDKIAAVEFDENTDPDEYLCKYGAAPLKRLIKNKLMELRS